MQYNIVSYVAVSLSLMFYTISSLHSSHKFDYVSSNITQTPTQNSHFISIRFVLLKVENCNACQVYYNFRHSIIICSSNIPQFWRCTVMQTKVKGRSWRRRRCCLIFYFRSKAVVGRLFWLKRFYKFKCYRNSYSIFYNVVHCIKLSSAKGAQVLDSVTKFCILTELHPFGLCRALSMKKWNQFLYRLIKVKYKVYCREEAFLNS